MSFRRIELDKWDRIENYMWFTTADECKISMTANIDITKLVDVVKERKLRCYPLFAYVISKVINQNEEFKMGQDSEGNLGVYDVVHPRYPVFHEEDKRLSILWTDYNEDFSRFYASFIKDIETYGEKRSMVAKGAYPPNCFDITSIPWVSFTSFNYLSSAKNLQLAPFVAVGKFFETNDSVMLPVSITSHHAVSDGYHVSQFFNQLQSLVGDPFEWINI